MCTISWLVSADGYEIFFNRDEQKTRAKALIPQQMDGPSCSALMPLDPQGNGTWFAVNDQGMSLALLNFYQGRMPKGRLISRGQIVRNGVMLDSPKDVYRYISSLTLSKYAPFSLLCFSRKDFVEGEQVVMWRWTGRELVSSLQGSPLISSGVKFDEVVESRLKAYQQIMADESENQVGSSLQSRREKHLRVHRDHSPSRSYLSLCMHREDAQTVSCSHVAVSKTEVVYTYTDGPACEDSAVSHHELALREP